MSLLQFADNTALINFCLIGRLALLRRLMNGGGAWSATVRIECEESAHYPGCADLASVHEFLGEPYAPESDAERDAVQNAWEYLREPGDGPEKHLGEAETIAVIATRGLPAIVVTDDTGAMRLARKHEVKVATTADLIVLAVKAGFIEAQDAWDCFTELQTTHRRSLPRAPESFAHLRARCGLI